jgi:ABC-type nitrate/sulfonate/bicarbonate transport system substrate-binding protein
MLRCAQSTRSNVLLKYAYARRFFARLAAESFEQPANKVLNGRARVLSGLIIRWIVAILVVVTGSFVISPLSAMASPMRIGVPSPSVSYFPAVVAWKKGFFAREGIQTEFIVMKPSIIPAALTNGEIQFSTATGTIVGAALRGFPFKIVTYYSIRLMDSLVAKPQIKSVTDLRGKIVGVDGPGASTYVMTVLSCENII